MRRERVTFAENEVDVVEQVEAYLSGQPESKQAELRQLHADTLAAFPDYVAVRSPRSLTTSSCFCRGSRGPRHPPRIVSVALVRHELALGAALDQLCHPAGAGDVLLG